ncbi:helix-turn-helix domain-containing protein [Cryobacterium sp. Y62]|uniref:helix-turn-helix domain-containing protein n=1 Tax=Cryobacterium sp. Y62 TaxID=2048284 RepID=UPI000CE3BCCA
MSCGEHGVTVAAVPWARHQTGHTLFSDDQIAWLATQTSKTAITVLMRIVWRAIGAIITRVWADIDKQVDQFADLNRMIARGVARAMRQDRQLHNRAPAGGRTNIVDDDRFGYS